MFGSLAARVGAWPKLQDAAFFNIFSAGRCAIIQEDMAWWFIWISWFVPKPALIVLSCGSTKVDLGIRSLNGQNACIGACHVGNQWQLALQLFTELLADRSGQSGLGHTHLCSCRVTEMTVGCPRMYPNISNFLEPQCVIARQQMPNTVSHSCTMSACDSQGS